MTATKHPHHQKYMDEVMAMLREEQTEGYNEHPCCHPSLEHSLSVLMEEVYELKEEIFKKPRYRDVSYIMEEAMDVAHCAIRMIIDMKCREAEGLKHHEHYNKAA